jgi:hypothetical protein
MVRSATNIAIRAVCDAVRAVCDVVRAVCGTNIAVRAVCGTNIATNIAVRAVCGTNIATNIAVRAVAGAVAGAVAADAAVNAAIRTLARIGRPRQRKCRGPRRHSARVANLARASLAHCHGIATGADPVRRDNAPHSNTLTDFALLAVLTIREPLRRRQLDTVVGIHCGRSIPQKQSNPPQMGAPGPTIDVVASAPHTRREPP